MKLLWFHSETLQEAAPPSLNNEEPAVKKKKTGTERSRDSRANMTQEDQEEAKRKRRDAYAKNKKWPAVSYSTRGFL